MVGDVSDAARERAWARRACSRRGRARNIGVVEFEFDPWKSESNKAKHGIDFVEAQSLWKSKHAVLGAKDALESATW